MTRKSVGTPSSPGRRKPVSSSLSGGAVPPTLELRLGKRISALREARGLTQEQIAASSGLSKGYFSKIENSKSIPPVGTLLKIANVLGIDMVELFNGEVEDTGEGPICVTRSQGAESLMKGKGSFGYDYFAIAQTRHDKHMHPFLMVFSPVAHKDIRFEHQGEEFIYILSGKIEFKAVIDGRPRNWILSQGDSIYFDSRIPHSARSIRGISRVLAVMYTASEHPLIDR